MDKNLEQLILGEIVIPSYAETNQQVTRDLADQLGISNLLNMPRCNFRNLLGKAIKHANRHHKDFETIMVHEGPNKIQYVIVRKETRDNGIDTDGNVLRDPDLGVEARFYFSKENRDNKKPANECINFWFNPNHPVARYIEQQYYNQAVIFSADDMRRSTNNMLISLGAIQITRGNAWFAPKQQEELLNKLTYWLKQVGCFAARYIQLDVGQVKENLQNVCQDGLATTLQDLFNLIEQHKLESNTRNSTLEKRIEDLNNLKTTIKLYTDAIGCDLSDLNNQVTTCENDLVNFMTGKQ